MSKRTAKKITNAGITYRIFFVFLFFLLASKGYSQTRKTRSISKGKCYEVPATFQCVEKECFLVINPDSDSPYSIKIDRPVTFSTGTIYLTNFKVHDDDEKLVNIIRYEKIYDELIEGMNEVACRSKQAAFRRPAEMMN